MITAINSDTMKNTLRNILLIAGLSLFVFTACKDDIDPIVEELEYDRAFTPLELTARIRNMTTLELTWQSYGDPDAFVVEISESEDFGSVLATHTVGADELPFQISLEGETLYHARVKAVKESSHDSKWVATSITTDAEQIFLSSQDGDIKATEVTVRWPEGSEVTHLVINPGGTERPISDEERASGIAVISGLTGQTEYTLILKNDEKTRGTKTFTTLIDFGDAMPIYPEDDIVAILDAAEEGDSFVVFPGEYQLGSYPVTKSFTLSGYDPYDKPVIYGQFACGAAVARVELNYLRVRGDGESSYGQFVNTSSDACDLTDLIINECEISHYSNGLIYNNASGKFGTITIKGSYIHDMPGDGGDGIDFRGGSLVALNVQNSTFANGFRTFLRMQVSAAISFRNCTFYKVATNNNGNNHGLFRASGGGTFEVRSCLFVKTGPEADPVGVQVGNFVRQASNMAGTPTYANNNIFACNNIFTGLYTTAAQVSATELDPGFVDEANGDFTVTNQDLIDNQIGDPRWLP